MTSSVESGFRRHVLRFIKMRWQIFIQCSFLTQVVLGIFSIISLQSGLVDIQLTIFEVVVRTATFIVVALFILGIVGLLLASNETIKSIKEKYKDVLQEAIGTDRYYHIWSDMARDIRIAESINLEGLNPWLLMVTPVVGLFTLASILAAYPAPHPFYQLGPTQILFSFLAILFLFIRRHP